MNNLVSSPTLRSMRRLRRRRQRELALHGSRYWLGAIGRRPGRGLWLWLSGLAHER